MLFSQPFFWRTHSDGRREVSWRVWVLIWVTPVLFAVAALMMLAFESYRHLASRPTTGEVVKVYSWPGGTIFDAGKTNYSPLYRYRWSDGEMTEATAGMSHPDWNFPLGSVHEIRYFPARKTNVVRPGFHNFAPGLVIAALALITAIPAFWGDRRVRRWRASTG